MLYIFVPAGLSSVDTSTGGVAVGVGVEVVVTVVEAVEALSLGS